jgi:hypothetical protein
MNEIYKDKMNLLVFIITIGLLIFSLFFVNGCASKTIVQKEIVTKKVYVKSPCPKLKVFDSNKSIILNAYNDGNKICVEEWKTCIPKEEMIKLISYIKYLKEINSKYKKEILEYNKKFTEENKTK